MKKIYLLVLTLAGVFSSQAQTVYTENMGTGASGNPTVTAYTGWQNTAPITYSGTGTVRTTSASTVYSGASGGNNVFLAAAGSQIMQIGGINTSAYNTADLQLSFGWLTTTTTAVVIVETSTDGTVWTPLTIPANSNTSWNLKTITSGIPSSSTLSLRFTGPVTTGGMRIDDIKIVNASSTCALIPATPTTLCDASTLGIDTYTITIPFTGGGTASYTITPSVTATVGGDNPNSVATGNITITGTNEGVDNSITITGGTCNYTIPVLAPTAGCKPVNTLPLNEPFNYASTTNLNSTQMWSFLNSGDNIVTEAGNLTYTGITSTGNRAAFAGAGAESVSPFTSTTSGAIYARFLYSVTDLTGYTAGASSYAIGLTDNARTSATVARVWIKENAGQYQYGLSSTTSATNVIWSPNLYNVGTTQYLLLAYNFADNSLALFENPTLPSTTTATVSLNPATAIANLGGVILRQDSAALTPITVIDELLIDTVAPDGLTLSRNNFNAISGLNIYPNPAKNFLNITSSSLEAKTVAIYNVLGAQVLAANVTNAPINIASLSKGVYVVKVTEEGKTATRKLVIE